MSDVLNCDIELLIIHVYLHFLPVSSIKITITYPGKKKYTSVVMSETGHAGGIRKKS